MSPAPRSSPRIAIIGAGMAGLTCATALKGMADVTLFEKSVFVGGRVSRHPFGEYRHYHGEQYITVSNPLFLKIVDSWLDAGLLRSWDAWVVELSHGQIVNLDERMQRYRGTPNMQAIADRLASGLQLRHSTAVAELGRAEDGRWQLFDDRGGYLGLYDIVIIATTAQQVTGLARAAPQIANVASGIDMTLCWSAVFEFGEEPGLPFDAAFVLDSPLSWIARLQPPQPGESGACWVVHASPEWSAQYAASFRGRVLHALLDAFFEACDLPPIKPLASNVHCWRHALPINTLGQDCLFDEQASIGACGDWCTAPRIEGAVLSGFSMADRVMKQLRKLGHG
jgi:predicted NAD/FAD-dependent oxidoreductase